MNRPYRQARSIRESKRSLVLQTAAFVWLLFLVAVVAPLLLGPVPAVKP